MFDADSLKLIVLTVSERNDCNKQKSPERELATTKMLQLNNVKVIIHKSFLKNDEKRNYPCILITVAVITTAINIQMQNARSERRAEVVMCSGAFSRVAESI